MVLAVHSLLMYGSGANKHSLLMYGSGPNDQLFY